MATGEVAYYDRSSEGAVLNSDIELEIGPGSGPGNYAVRVIRAPAGGEPTGTLRLDVEELLSRRHVLEVTVLASAVGRRSVPINEWPVRDVGRQLFRALFTGQIIDAYRASLAVAQRQGRKLRLVLRLTARELAVLPWETLFDPETETYLCLTEQLVRLVPAPYTAVPLEVRPPLRILGLIASPQGLPSLDVDAEKALLAEALAEPLAEGLVEVVWVPEATWDGVHARLLAGQWHVLHFVGRGDYDTRTDEGVLALVGRDGRADLVEARRLADLLGEAQPTPRLVVLNSRSSGQTGTNDLFSGTAAALVRGGISAVIAMQFAISDTAAVAFARGLYTAIARGRNVDEAARSGRISILGTPRSLEWVAPVLYVRGLTTQLFTAPPASSRAGQFGRRDLLEDALWREDEPRVIVDDDVRFTIYRPQILLPGVGASLLFFAHKTTLLEEPGKTPIDPNALVEDRARAHFGDTVPRPVIEDARHGLIRGAQLRIAPDLPGIQCDPPEAEIGWREPVHELMFRLLAGADLAGSVVRGAVRIWCGPLILGEVSLAISIATSGATAESQPVINSALRYRKIFPSYSHKDRAMVAAFAEVARALGDQYLQDVLTLRAGERWESRLLELIEDADVFQLFWSRNSMYSRHCQNEWEHALALRRPSFVKPLYWEEPLPEDAGLGLPPVTLRELHFAKVLVEKLALLPPGVTGSSPTYTGQPAAWPPAYGHQQPYAGPSGGDFSWPPKSTPIRASRRRTVVLAAALILVLAVVVVLIASHAH